MNETKAEEMIRNEVGASGKAMTDDQLAEVSAGKTWPAFLLAMSRMVDETDDPRFAKIRELIHEGDYMRAQAVMIQLLDEKNPIMHRLLRYL